MPKFFISHYRRGKTPSIMVRPLFSFKRISPLFLFVISFAALCLFYVWQITALSMRGYVKNDLLGQRAALQDEAERTRLVVLEHQSLARVDERLRELNLVPANRVERVTREEMHTSVSIR